MKRHILIPSLLSSFFTLAVVIVSLLIISGALAAPAADVSSTKMQQSTAQKNYISISSMAFQPFSPRTLPYRRGFDEQILALDTTSREIEGQNNWYVAPLSLPDNTIITGITFYGRDVDPNGWVEIALWRCTHGGDVSCVNLPLSSYRTDEPFASGSFDSGQIALNEVVNNQIYSYTLATRIVALNGSGLRSVLVETAATNGTVSPPPGSGGSIEGPVSWTLNNRNVTTQLSTNLSPTAEVRICSNSGSSADVEIRYDNNTETLTPGNCARSSGYSAYSVKNVGVYGSSASGTFEVLRN
ncbi:MAG: hypothetical protein KDJ65_34100 [Anaerolineae bacterium]|nr:hypothetical protein [Anaerolineae bacterium]